MTCVTNLETDDRVLIQRLCDGDQRAFATLYERHLPQVLAVARRLLFDSRAAEDVAQEVFAYVWGHPERIDLARGELRALLVTITRRRAIDAIRSQEGRRRMHQRLAVQPPLAGEELSRDVADALVDADASSRQRCALHEAVDRLPVALQTSVRLAFFEGHTYREVAQVMSVPEGTAKSRLRLALRRLENALPASQADRETDFVMPVRRAS